MIGVSASPPSAGRGPARRAAAAAKALVQFAKDQPKFKLKAGSLGARQIGIAEIKGLAELPPREVLLGSLLGSMKAPSTGLVMVLSGVPRKFLYALNAIKDAKAKAALPLVVSVTAGK